MAGKNIITRTSAKGFSLIELMISAAVLIATLVPMLVLFYHYLVVVELSRNSSVAVSDASFILESIRSTEPFTVNNVVNTYPPGADVSSKIGPVKLKDETVRVFYQDPSADPLIVTVRVDWKDEVRVRDRSLTITTKMTSR